MTLFVILFLLVALAVLSLWLGADSRPLGMSKWGDQRQRPRTSRW